ncbi:UDP-N-acetylmuramoyl-tripeptide--D-alanyl-D-alanine ligase [Clostridium sp. 'White wine YQ']|uniref:UDP-N-acetylmuramoyl-tripeptide--D-alanyl-D- alanine ligase n=1 Tax=Clostridium sp. 'White wine YQ' TaxID=3027474 RepID=UPI0023673671|nr:UDP-N-acetylmuramoyl-tripeptide--D-alanyl-D-alanine ligase [Clostridium sp. 'White wine YQ']MDD7793975.1 UDP-N-acetylmuramoyl-tripeptide--D-alanyl-D-alanine ligase [Clostridium sp. 'White wine YQ']
MEKLRLEEIITAVNGKVLSNGTLEIFDKITTDSRKIEKDSIFFALKGENFNGNEYIGTAIKNGAKLCVVDEDVTFDENIDCSIIKVDNSRTALLDLAEYYRSKLSLKVIGVTGSTGKTSTKDIIAAILSEKFKVFKTKGNFNNEIGVPLMIFELDNSYDVAVLEMGMSDFGEIHRLAKAARPDISVITNIGISHIENLGTQEGILKAKMEITDYFNEKSILILNSEDKYLNTVKDRNFRIIRCGVNESSDLKAAEIHLMEEHVEFSIWHNDNFCRFKIDAPGEHSVLNGLLGIACSLELGLTFEEMKKGLNNLERTSMRLEFIRKNDITIINDCYNASPQSMKAALDVQKNTKGKRKIAVLGTMLELGQMSFEAHKEVGKYAKEIGIDELLVTGEYSTAYKEGFGDSIRSFKSKEELIKFLDEFIDSEDCILIKASRGMKFEEIVHSINN